MAKTKSGPIYTYVRFVMDQEGISAAELAARAGIAASTITRFLNNPDYKFTLSNTTIKKIADATGINPAPFFESRDFAQSSLLPHTDLEKVYDKRWGLEGYGSLGSEERGLIMIIGDVEAGKWREAALMPVTEAAPIAITIGNIPSAACFAVRVRGHSLDKIARDGEFLVCIRHQSEHSHEFYAGMVFVVERQLNDGRLIELSARVLRRQAGSWYLCHASSDSRYDEMLPATSINQPTGYKVLGRAEFVYRSIIEDYDAQMHDGG